MDTFLEFLSLIDTFHLQKNKLEIKTKEHKNKAYICKWPGFQQIH